MRELDEWLDDILSKRAKHRSVIEQRDAMLGTLQNLALREDLSRTFQPHLASDRRWHPELFRNIEV